MKFPRKPTQQSLEGATVFTVPTKMDERDQPPGGPFFTDTNQGADLDGRTLNGEPIGKAKDNAPLTPPFDKALSDEWNKGQPAQVDVPEQGQLRDLSDYTEKDSPLKGTEGKKLNGT